LKGPEVRDQLFGARSALGVGIDAPAGVSTAKQLPPNRHFTVWVRRLETTSIDEVTNVGCTERTAIARREKGEVRWTTSKPVSPRPVASTIAAVALCAVAGEVGFPPFHGGIGRFELSLQNEPGDSGNCDDDDERG